MADKKNKDKELSTNSEVQRSDEFQDRIIIKEKVLESVKKLLESSTEDAFSKLGYERVEGKAGVYGDDSEYGSGAKENKYQIRLAGKTKTNVEKQIIFGAKRMEAEINIDYRDDVAVIEYKTTEAGAFRGANKDSKYTGAGKALMINEKATIPASNIKEFDKKLKTFFDEVAKREIDYLTTTKLGVEDRLEVGTTSIVNESEKITEMKKLSLKGLLFGDEEPDGLNEGKKTGENIEKIKSSNTIPLKDVKPKSKDSEKGKYLFFDGKKKGDVKKKHKTIEERDKEISEITTAGPGGAGAGRYDTPYAFKNTAYFKNKKSKRPKVDKDYNVVKENDNYNVVKETKGNSDNFWSVVKIDPNYHPLGMPFVKPGSKEEWDNTIHGDKTKYKRMGLKEDKVSPDLTKKKIFSEEENKAKGINKRYLVTERTTEEYEKERWKRLSNFKTYETVKEAEEMNRIFEESENQEDVTQRPLEQISETFIQNEEEEVLSEDTSHTVSSNEETVEVEKPTSSFGTPHKFYKKDFLNEEKKYILDLNSMVFVQNPNSK